MEAKVFIWFWNNFQNGNHFHLIGKNISKMEMVSISFGYSFQLIWKLSLDWYPNQMKTVSVLEINFQISWILVAINDTSCGYPFWISDHWEYIVWRHKNHYHGILKILLVCFTFKLPMIKDLSCQSWNEISQSKVQSKTLIGLIIRVRIFLRKDEAERREKSSNHGSQLFPRYIAFSCSMRSWLF